MSRRRIIILSCLGFGLVVILGGVILFIKQFSQPDQGIIKVGGSSSSPPTSITVSLVPTLGSDKYVSFDYPSGMSKQSSAVVVAPSVADFIFTARDIQSWLLAIDITSDPSGNLANNSGYTLRKNNPNEYHESQVMIHGVAIPVMTDTTAPAFSQVAFLSHENWVATVSLIGDDADGAQPLQTSFNMVLNSWHWLI